MKLQNKVFFLKKEVVFSQKIFLNSFTSYFLRAILSL